MPTQYDDLSTKLSEPITPIVDQIRRRGKVWAGGWNGLRFQSANVRDIDDGTVVIESRCDLDGLRNPGVDPGDFAKEASQGSWPVDQDTRSLLMKLLGETE